MLNGDISHKPVMLQEVMECLAVQPGAAYVDCTFGRGGYSAAILYAGGNILAIDRDIEAIDIAHKMGNDFPDRMMVRHGDFANVLSELANSGNKFDGVVMDLGVSSPQLDDAQRGFSFKRDGPLDMRMDRSQGISAADVVNTFSQEDIANIIYNFGEERMSRVISRAICKEREKSKFESTLQLASLVRSIVRPQRNGLDPATRTFQGLRIYVNQELHQLEQGLESCLKCLKVGGRIVIVSFHSLEDRIVKQFMKKHSSIINPSRHHLVRAHDDGLSLKLLTKKALSPKSDEIDINPRATSAKLRAAVFIGNYSHNDEV